MLGVIFDVFNKEIGNYSGNGYCSKLSLLNYDLFTHFLFELSSVGVKKTILISEIYTDYAIKSDVELIVVKNIPELREYLKKCDEDVLVTLFCDSYFEFDSEMVYEYTSVLSYADFCDETGNSMCKISSFKAFCEETEAFDFNGENYVLLKKHFFESNNQPKINVVKNYHEITTLNSYKSLLVDILNNKTSVLLPRIAQGVYASGNIPKGDFVIIPPVYFGENVQIESACVIGPNTIISDNVLISSESYIKNSFLGNDVFVSSGCFADNIFCCENVVIRRNSAVFSGTVLGREATVTEGCVIENNSFIKPFVRVSEYKNNYVNYSYGDNESLSGFYGYTPEKAALLGGALGVTFENKKIGILSNGEINSNILKLALLSGFMSVGSACFDFGYSFEGSVLYFINYCEADYGVFIDGTESGTVISVVDKYGQNLSKNEFYSVKELLLNNQIPRCSKEQCKNVTNLHGMVRLYTGFLTRNITDNLQYYPVFNCPDSQIMKIISKAASKLIFSDVKEKINFNINRNGTWCEAVVDNEIYSKRKLCDFISFYDEIPTTGNREIWRYDSVFLCFKVLEIISKLRLDFTAEIKNIPSFYLAERVVSVDKNLPYIASRLSDGNELVFKNDEIELEKGNLRLKLFNNGNGNKLKILARSIKAEMAEEFAIEAEKMIRHIMD